MKDYYKVLQIDAMADPAVVQGAYRALLKSAKHHPDLGGSLADAQEINEAYAVLGDAEQRKSYDSQYTPEAAAPRTVVVPRYILICPGCGAKNLLQHTEDLVQFRCSRCSRSLVSSDRLAHPEDIKRSFRLGIYLFERKMFERAGKEFEAVARADPENSATHYWLGRNHYQRRLYDKARAEFKVSVTIEPSRFHFQFWSGLANHALKDFPAAAGSFARAAKLRPGHLPTLLRLGSCYAHLREFGKAVQAMQSAVAKHAYRPEAHIRLGLYLLADQHIEEAAASLRKAKKLAPEHPLVQKYLSLVE